MNLRVCVVGTGALGSALLEHLRVQRANAVLLVDPDRLADHNLPMSTMLSRALKQRAQLDVAPKRAPYKAELLAEAVRSTDKLPWRALPIEIADVGWQDLHDIDLFCCCTDSVLSRAELAWTARLLRKPVLDGAVFGDGITEGRVSFFPAVASAACYLCGLSEDRRAAVLGDAVSTSLGCLVPEEAPQMTGALATLEAVAGGMATCILQRDAQSDVAWADRLRLGADDVSRQQHRLLRLQSATCPWHEGLPSHLEELPWEEPLKRTLRAGQTLILNWPVCIDAICPKCGKESSPRLRVALARRSRCPHCHEPGLEPARTVQQISRTDGAAELSPRQLGQPSRHLYWLSHANDFAAS